jgi:hypothetical protein
MKNEVTKPNNTELATSNPFLDYGAQASQSSIVGKLLKFSKGDWTAGQSNEEIPDGTEFVANMDELMAGWIRWSENKPTDQVMGKISEGYQAPRRSDLGDNVKEDWEVDEQNGKPRDPWQFSNYLLLRGQEDAELYTFTTSSRGGLNAIGDLCKVYGKVMSQHPKEWPVLSIGQGAYDHPNRSYGKIKFPTFAIVGWAPKAVFDDVASGGEAEIPFEEPTKPAASAASKMIRKAGRI